METACKVSAMEGMGTISGARPAVTVSLRIGGTYNEAAGRQSRHDHSKYFRCAHRFLQSLISLIEERPGAGRSCGARLQQRLIVRTWRRRHTAFTAAIGGDST
jgi:hypothetical protein